MRKYKQYPKYKPSGVEWMGVIPEGWGLKRLRFCAEINPKWGGGVLNGLKDTDEVSFVPMEDVPENETDLIAEKTALLEKVKNGYTFFTEGDVIVAKITPCYENGKGAIAGKLVNGVAFGTTELHVIKAGKELTNKYLFYYTKLKGFREHGEASMKGAAGQKRVPELYFKDCLIPMPKYAAQKEITNFIDKEAGRIDKVIEKQKQFIELLKEKRAAVITHAVTKGLDPKAKMKTSGVDWIGDIPEGWEAKRLKFLLKPQKGAVKSGPFGAHLKIDDMKGTDVKVYDQKNVIERDINEGSSYISNEKFEELQGFEVFKGDLLVTTRGTIGRCYIVPDNAERGILHPCLMRVQLDERKIDPLLIEILINDSSFFLEQMRALSNGTTIEVIYTETIKNIIIITPPKSEQAEIIKYLNEEIYHTDKVIEKTEKWIDLMQEYRQSLVIAAVTGQIDVRDAE
ncbi:MAG: hypothetical protein A2270_10445 [Elusimicrobia bacterium RIFOXYA12_FULL_51_18]|nr:MAG: hypothetical protein A2270_10445 [Elusimicrobia bacterium RIFOXYA12_FULL_51_18]OGS29517.1 MAG: hypothetical protein A2218_00745 [Elusimicrobia bacterium RIFOXYA2_FULL_53_38]